MIPLIWYLWPPPLIQEIVNRKQHMWEKAHVCREYERKVAEEEIFYKVQISALCYIYICSLHLDININTTYIQFTPGYQH